MTIFRRLAAFCRGRLAQNAIALYGVTIANSILPLLTVPYLARVLGSGAWGMVLFAQTVAAWPAMLVEFGFVYSATREVARHAGDPEKLREIVGEVMACKLGLSILGAATGIAFWFVVPEFRQQPLFLIGALWLALAHGFNPLWYFQGTQRMSLPAIIEVVCRLLFTISVFFLIKGPGDATRVILYQAAGLTLSLGITLGLMFRTVSFRMSGFARAARALREAWPFFLFVAIISLYAKANSFLLGILIAPAIVSFYGGPERLLRAFLSFTSPINQVPYPHLAHLQRPHPAARRPDQPGAKRNGPRHPRRRSLAAAQKSPALGLHLVGRPQANYRTQPELVALLARPGVRVLGYLSEQDLGSAFTNADVVCHPSLEESFGLPVLEAMVASAPVVTSDASCFPEIAGGAALLVDPHSADSIAAGIRPALEEPPGARAQRTAR